MQQMFMNIVRVYKHEPTLFMDVTEIDAAMSLAASLGGSKTGIGARAGMSGGTLAGPVGSITGNLGYQESPTVRYQPLQGQPLVQQIGSPITVDTIARLYDSEWRISVILSFALDRITQSFVDSRAIINAIDALDDYGVIGLVAAKSASLEASGSPTTTKKSTSTDLGTITIATKPGGSGNGEEQSDTLAIYLRRGRPLLYAGETLASETAQIEQLWQRLKSIYGEGNSTGARVVTSGADKSKRAESGLDMIEIRNVPARIPARGTGDGKKGEKPTTIEEAPAMRTHSAIGIVRVAFDSSYGIEIMSRARYEAIRNAPWNLRNAPWNVRNTAPNADCFNVQWYTVLPRACKSSGDSTAECNPPSPQNLIYETLAQEPPIDGEGLVYRASQTIRNFIEQSDKASNHSFRCLYTASMFSSMGSGITHYQDILDDYRLYSLRREILIISDKTCPTNAYVSYSDETGCYYIDSEDKFSQKNFELISIFLTMQAVPPTTAPLTPSISVGGPGG
jgi:hypothetical protein